MRPSCGILSLTSVSAPQWIYIQLQLPNHLLVPPVTMSGERADIERIAVDSLNGQELGESDKRLMELGYRPEFKREMSLIGVLGISFCSIGILTGMSSAFQTGLFSGGPLGLFWGWNICSLFMLLIALSQAEICSAYPTMGGLYFWVCKMKPDLPVLGYCTGWIYAIAMNLTGTSGNLSVALYFASLAEVGTGRNLTRVEIVAIAWGVNIFSGIVNTIGTKAIGRMSSFNIWWTLGGTFVLVITLLVKAPVKNTADFVFTDLENFTGWESKGFVVLLGFLQAVYSLEGSETAGQVAEEAKRAELLAPIAVVGSIVGSWIIGLAYILALLFSVQSIPSVQSTSFAIPIAQLYYDAVGKRLTLLCLTVIGLAQLMAAITAFTASSRLYYALARDNAFPLKKHFMALNRYQAPYVGVWVSVFVGCVISCAYIGSVIAFNAILSSAAIAVMLGYLQPILIRVFWPSALSSRGPFHLGKWSWTINALSFAFTVFICVLFILPTAHPVTKDNMNYAIVSVGGIMLIVATTWIFWGRFSFKGPIYHSHLLTDFGLGDLSLKIPPGRYGSPTYIICPHLNSLRLHLSVTAMDSASEHSEKGDIVHGSEVDVAAQFSSASAAPLDPQVALRLRRKIDLYLMPLMCIMYLMTFADKTALGQSAVLGIIPGAHLNQNQFNWLGSVFYLSYLVFMYPQNLALQRFPVGKWMSVNIFCWAIVLLCHAACHSFGGLFAVRFLLGVFEGAVTPGFMIVTSMFYTREEQTKRTGYWFLMNGFAIIFLGFVAFGVLHTHTDNFMPWQWLMIITGILTLITSVLFWFLFPDSPTTAWFLTPEERVLAVERIKVNQTGVENKHWKRDQFIETLTDRKIWVMALFAAILNIINSLTNQRQLIVSQFGFSTIETTLLGCVDGVVEILSIWLGVYLSGFRHIGRAWAGVIILIPALLGALLVNCLPSHMKVGLLFGYWLSIFAIAPSPILLGWVSGIVSGHTKRITTNAVVLIAYSVGNFAGPFVWKKQYQPRNHVPWDLLAASMGASAILMLALRSLLAAENRKRDREQHDDTFDHVLVTVVEDGKEVKKRVDKAFLDLTDLQNREFRYIL
ncbi:hypothetical protein D9758_000775 [Tetrapyrgos nigripes]|uniref:Uncharacterized protein n=1 Tax=Tetrapyrgos nigripes TaxID=182062 RepID=A0A8H5GYN7_9AGAR|nr:hypothetical protein D9758_000775 [Tetrapyrgos nigripes]